MARIFFDPRQGIPLSEEEKMLVRLGHRSYLSTIAFPADRMPELFRHPEWRTVEIEGHGKFYPMADWRIFELKRAHVRIFEHNPLQFHIAHHTVAGVHLIHILMACLDERPEPYIAETYLNPTYPDHTEVLGLLAEAPYIAINLWLHEEFVQTRLVDNPLREQAAEIRRVVADVPAQPVDVFMAARERFEAATELKYKRFSWSSPLRSIRLNYV